MAPKQAPIIFALACSAAILIGNYAINFTLPPSDGAASAPPRMTTGASQYHDLMKAESIVEAPSPWLSSSSWVPLLGGAMLGLAIVLMGNASPASASEKAWGYRETDKWKTDYPFCDDKEQSPVDLFSPGVVTRNMESTLAPNINYLPLENRFFTNNKGKTAQMNGDFGVLKLPDGDYAVRQFHFHFPSEHTVGGKDLGYDVEFGHHTAGELHIVHQKVGSKGQDGLAMIGIMLEEGDAQDGPDQAFFKQLGFGTELPGERMKLKIAGAVDLNSFQSQLNGPFWHYKGSLTTPPCTENVHWYVMDKPSVITKDMIASFRSRFPPDNRTIQGLGLREMDIGSVALPGEFDP